MNVTRRPKTIKVTRRKVSAKRKTSSYSVTDAFMEALMTLPDQNARSVALDAATGIGPGVEDTIASARIVLRAAKRLKWGRYRAMAKLAEYAGVSL